MVIVGAGALRRPYAGFTTTVPRCRSPPRAGSGPALAGLEDHPELADLHLVAVPQHGLVDPVSAHVGPVQAADVPDDELALPADELGVLARHRHVVQEDVAARVAARRGALGVQQEA